MSGLDVRSFSLGPVQTNAYIARADSDQSRGVLIDPGEEPQRLLDAMRALGVELDAILVTHCHFDHIGAVAPMAKATGAPVYCPEAERVLLADIMSYVLPGFGPFESYEAEHLLSGGEHLALGALSIDVLATPGHSPGHLTYAGSAASSAQVALFSGDVLFQGSVGRVDLPGGDWTVLERSIAMLMTSFSRETTVYPGHMGATTLGRELDTNPFLEQVRAGISARPTGRTTPTGQPSESSATSASSTISGVSARSASGPGTGGADTN
jgi:hydroxyacylglutathione hydrolase